MGKYKFTLELFNCQMKRRSDFFCRFILPFLSEFFSNLMELLHKFWLFPLHLNLPGGCYIDLRVSIFTVNSIYLNLCLKFNDMLKIPAYQHRNIMNTGSCNMHGVRQVPCGNNFFSHIDMRYLFNFVAIWKKINIVFSQRSFEFIAFGYLRGTVNFFNKQLSAIQNDIGLFDKFEEFLRRYFLFCVIAIQPVYNRSININSHIPTIAHYFIKVKIRGCTLKDGVITAYDAALALEQGKTTLEAAQIAYVAVGL
ncbi:MAG: hypothetical protein A3G38_00015 [Omnitrophica WOR_2 bacterium RIFCSPLOWO2_12_FULL_51_8]|nr:MAG: hypothetical protein A3G38_00015 [Omnitrophica WOR_2 bacterium RIFCSPLOWO2_12_FULL_51_8]